MHVATHAQTYTHTLKPTQHTRARAHTLKHSQTQPVSLQAAGSLGGKHVWKASPCASKQLLSRRGSDRRGRPPTQITLCVWVCIMYVCFVCESDMVCDMKSRRMQVPIGEHGVWCKITNFVSDDHTITHMYRSCPSLTVSMWICGYALISTRTTTSTLCSSKRE